MAGAGSRTAPTTVGDRTTAVSSRRDRGEFHNAPGLDSPGRKGA